MRWYFSLPVALALVCLPAECACGGPRHTITFPARRAAPGPRLLASSLARIYPAGRFRKFGQEGEDFLFLASLPLPSRKLCSAQLEMHVRRLTGRPSFDFNDFLLIGFAPFGSSGERKALFRAPMWAGDPPQISEKTARLSLPALELNRFVLLTESPHFLDVILHDDTAVDWVKLIVRYE